jgi:GNAT superfamily N-acetyltransferase
MCSASNVTPFRELKQEDGRLHYRGNQVWLRRLEAYDRPLIEGFLARIDPQDLQMRFFSALRSVSPALLDLLTQIDRKELVTLVAVGYPSPDAPEILAVAHAHAQSRASAEVALLVRSDLKGKGIGAMILDRLIADCQRRGSSLLVADVLQHNERMLRLAQRRGFRRQAAQHGTVRLVLDVDPMAA